MLLVDIYRATYETFSPSPKYEKTHSEKMSYIFPKKVFLKFWEMELCNPKFKKLIFFRERIFHIFQEGTLKAQKTKTIHSEEISYITTKEFSPHFGMIADQAVKLKIPSYSRITAD